LTWRFEDLWVLIFHNHYSYTLLTKCGSVCEEHTCGRGDESLGPIWRGDLRIFVFSFFTIMILVHCYQSVDPFVRNALVVGVTKVLASRKYSKTEMVYGLRIFFAMPRENILSP